MLSIIGPVCRLWFNYIISYKIQCDSVTRWLNERCVEITNPASFFLQSAGVATINNWFPVRDNIPVISWQTTPLTLLQALGQLDSKLSQLSVPLAGCQHIMCVLDSQVSSLWWGQQWKTSCLTPAVTVYSFPSAESKPAQGSPLFSVNKLGPVLSHVESVSNGSTVEEVSQVSQLL